MSETPPPGIVTLAGKWWLLSDDSHISRWCEQWGDIVCDPWAISHILPLIPVGGTVIDVGASIGDHTVPYLDKVGPKGLVIAFEPLEAAYLCLCHNAPGATCIRAAVGEAPGRAMIRRAPNAGASMLSTLGGDEVPVVTIDSLCLPRLDLLKIDAEGCEPAVLRGANDTLAACRPKIICEINRGALALQGFTPEDVVDCLTLHDYRFKILQPGITWDADQFDLIARP